MDKPISPHRQVSALPAGTSMARAVWALANSKGEAFDARFICQQRQWADAAEYLTDVLEGKGAIGGGSTSDSTFASPLAYASYAASDFLSALRTRTVVDRLSGLRRVPMNIKVARETAASSVSWVAEGASIPVSKMALEQVALGIAKCAGLVVVSKDLARSASPDAIGLIRNDLITGAVRFLDAQFLNPAIAAVANTNPASVTNGATATQSSATTATQVAAELKTFLQTFADNEELDENFVLIMTPACAMALGALRDTAGGVAFPDVGLFGGNIWGVPVLTSNAIPHSVSAGSIIVGLNTGAVLYADDGSVDVAVSEHATIEMDSAPTNNSLTPTGTQQVSMFQTNSVAVLMAMRRNWKLARTTACAYLDNVHF